MVLSLPTLVNGITTEEKQGRKKTEKVQEKKQKEKYVQMEGISLLPQLHFLSDAGRECKDVGSLQE